MFFHFDTERFLGAFLKLFLSSQTRICTFKGPSNVLQVNWLILAWCCRSSVSVFCTDLHTVSDRPHHTCSSMYRGEPDFVIVSWWVWNWRGCRVLTMWVGIKLHTWYRRDDNPVSLLLSCFPGIGLANGPILGFHQSPAGTTTISEGSVYEFGRLISAWCCPSQKKTTEREAEYSGLC